MSSFALFATLNNRPVLVVGGGKVAARKIDALIQKGARVQVVAKTLCPSLQKAREENALHYLGETFDESQLDAVFLVIAATDDSLLNQRIFQAAERAKKLCNVVDSPDLCSFTTPAVVDRSPLQIAISSNGAAPVLTRLWREKLETLLPQHLGNMAQHASQWRERVKQRLPNLTLRRQFWETVFRHPEWNWAHEQHNIQAAERVIQTLFESQNQAAKKGVVALVGAGVGDAGLLTLKALQHIQAADVVLYDALVSEEVLNLIRRDAEKICVGKQARSHSVQQEHINELLLKHAQLGKRVVRLKGGDPFVFGRGGEELQFLRQANIDYVVVPGITAALGATAYAGIPLTHRHYAQSVTFITGHCQANGQEPHWPSLAQSQQTLVIYMGTIQAAHLSKELIRHGRSENTPIAIISHGTRPSQEVLSGSLKNLPQLAEKAKTPALIVIGETAALHEELNWFSGSLKTES